jgi:hypothetical protein
MQLLYSAEQTDGCCYARKAKAMLTYNVERLTNKLSFETLHTYSMRIGVFSIALCVRSLCEPRGKGIKVTRSNIVRRIAHKSSALSAPGTHTM